jgi:hypothetical protein
MADRTISAASPAKKDPKPGAYRPYVSARRPGAGPATKPTYRVLVHREFLDEWNSLVDRVGLNSAQQFWDHVATTPGQQPSVGRSSMMKGKHHGPKWPGYSPTIHYEISGSGRLNYQFNPTAEDGSKGDRHSVVKILSIDLGSH